VGEADAGLHVSDHPAPVDLVALQPRLPLGVCSWAPHGTVDAVHVIELTR
jgi:hypothetical protein